MSYYNGWWISYSGARPVTGQWVAKRHGVTMSAGSKDALRSMIDTRNRENKQNQLP